MMEALSTEATASEPTRGDASTPAEIATRDRIVAAALEVFVEKGYGGTRVQDIAEHAGLTPGALYVHFPNRTKLLAEAITVEGRRIISELIEHLGQTPPGDRRISKVLTAQMVAEPLLLDRLLVEAFALASRDPDSHAQLTTTLGHLDVFISETVRTSIEIGSLDSDLDPDAVTAFFSSWILGIIVHRAIARPRPDATEMLAVVGRLMDGLGPRGER